MVRNAGGGGWVGMPKRYEGVGVFMLALRNVNFLLIQISSEYMLFSSLIN